MNIIASGIVGKDSIPNPESYKQLLIVYDGEFMTDEAEINRIEGSVWSGAYFNLKDCEGCYWSIIQINEL